ncbi:MAG TPA: vWA domain-containing protein [Kofleriaceae bacterium]|nr:vWA domain-containing protein [Kofleriaceae bacterium]
MKPALLAVALVISCGGAMKPSAPMERAVSGAPPYGGGGEVAGEEPPAIARSGVAAGEWDDNANYREFGKFLAGAQVGYHRLDIGDRQFLVVRDAAGKGVPACTLEISDRQGGRAALTTLGSGRALLFPHAEGLSGSEVHVTARCAGAVVDRDLTLVAGEGVHTIDLPSPRVLAGRPTVDVAVILDTTGSMAEEITAVKQTIQQVADGLGNLGADVRIELVEYRDVGDEFVTRVYPFTTDLAAFAGKVERIEADGGGDRPEHVDAGLATAVNALAWNPQAVARVAFLIGDAPPHLDYAQDTSYAASARVAARKGIQLFTVAASGMDLLGQVVFRQIAQYTGATNLFVLRGGAGPQSTGAGDPASSCGGTQTEYTSGNLDALIIARIRGAVAAVDADPMRIAGLGQDENAKPCAERIASVIAR